MTKPVTALVIAKIDPMGDSLLVLLQSLPQIEIVQRARNYQAARQLTIHPPPVVVVLDADSHDLELTKAVQGIKVNWPRARIIVLVENEPQEQTARLAGADAAFTKGIQAKKLLEATELLLQSETSQK